MAVQPENIVFIGMPGAGKSTLGVVVAKMLMLDFLDTDLLIQNKTKESLQRSIERLGVWGFIELENEVLCNIAAKNSLIATGGSAVYSKQAMHHLARIARIVYLQVSYDEIEERLGSYDERGVVMRGGCIKTLADLYAERTPLYEHFAQLTVNIDGMGVREAAEKLCAYFV